MMDGSSSLPLIVSGGCLVAHFFSAALGRATSAPAGLFAGGTRGDATSRYPAIEPSLSRRASRPALPGFPRAARSWRAFRRWGLQVANS